jgi:hypothetical protein
LRSKSCDVCETLLRVQKAESFCWRVDIHGSDRTAVSVESVFPHDTYTIVLINNLLEETGRVLYAEKSTGGGVGLAHVVDEDWAARLVRARRSPVAVKLSMGSETYSAEMDSGGGCAGPSVTLAVLKSAELTSPSLKEGPSKAGISIGVPSGLKPMSARRLKERAKALFMAFVVWHIASTSAGRHVEARIFANICTSVAKQKGRIEQDEGLSKVAIVD